MTEDAPARRRAGGRAARKAMRADPSARPVPTAPGQIGGAYKPLSDTDVTRVADAAFDVLEHIGMGETPQSLIDLAVARGAILDEHGRVRFPRAFVEDVIDGAARDFVLHGRDPKHDIEVTGTKVHYGTGGAAVRTLDFDTGIYRPSTLNDLYDFARLADSLENVAWFTRCVVATDLEDNYELDVNTAYATACGTTKHIGTSFFLGEYVDPVIQMFDAIGGGEGTFAKRPFCKVHISPVISPLRYGEDAVDVAFEAIKANMPINVIIAAQSGATAPAPPATMLVHTVAETLAGLILTNLIKPGHPTVFSNWPFVIDLRTGAFSGSGGEISVLNAGAAQMANHFGLPSGVAASMADSKVPDAQAGYEKAISLLATGLAGANMIYESAGMFASLLGASFEGMVIDNEIIGVAQRVVRGFEVTDELIALDVIRDAVFGAGHFLGHDQTIAAMERDYYYPDLADRESPDAWAEQGSTDMRERARVKTADVLATHFPNYVDAAVDAEIRARFPIRLQEVRMRRPG